MYQFKKLHHPADIKILVKADSIKNLFIGSARALAEILSSKENVRKDQVIEKEISLQSIDISSLLIDFLSQILAFSDIENAIFKEIEIIKLTENEVFAKIKGQPVTKFDQEIKAVTYYQSLIEKQGNLYTTTILFDI
ncbi:MAG: archease [Minisyncoccia bacterium]